MKWSRVEGSSNKTGKSQAVQGACYARQHLQTSRVVSVSPIQRAAATHPTCSFESTAAMCPSEEGLLCGLEAIISLEWGSRTTASSFSFIPGVKGDLLCQSFLSRCFFATGPEQ